MALSGPRKSCDTTDSTWSRMKSAASARKMRDDARPPAPRLARPAPRRRTARRSALPSRRSGSARIAKVRTMPPSSIDTCARRAPLRAERGVGGFGEHRDERLGQRGLAQRPAFERMRIEIEDMGENGSARTQRCAASRTSTPSVPATGASRRAGWPRFERTGKDVVTIEILTGSELPRLLQDADSLYVSARAARCAWAAASGRPNFETPRPTC